MKRFLLACLASACFFSACTSNNSEQELESAESIQNNIKAINSELIKNPITADENISAENAPIITFEEESFHFGEIPENGIVEHRFKFTNTGKSPLIIQSAKAGCGCTVPTPPRDPIAPGESNEILVKFNPKGKSGPQTKNITITANTIPSTTVLRIMSVVKK